MTRFNIKPASFFFVAILCLSALMFWHSYQPSARYSTIIGNETSRAKFDCIYNSQTQTEDPADILIFGSSRAGSYFDDRFISRWVSEFSGEPTYVQNLNVAGGDISLSYIFLKEYLEKNNPDIVYVEVLRIKPQVSLIPYVNRAFSSTADWDTTNDLLRDFEDNRSLFFRAADMFRVMIDKTDKYLSKLLVREYSITVKNPEACIRNEMIKTVKNIDVDASKKRFSALYKREVENLIQNAKSANAIRRETNLPRRERALKRHREKMGKAWETAEPKGWDYDTDMAKRQLYYFEKLEELTAEKGVELVYFRPYGLFDAEYTANLIEKYEGVFGADIIYPPYDMAKLAYPYYVDPNHAGKQSRRAFALWLTEDIMTRTGKF